MQTDCPFGIHHNVEREILEQAGAVKIRCGCTAGKHDDYDSIWLGVDSEASLKPGQPYHDVRHLVPYLLRHGEGTSPTHAVTLDNLGRIDTES